MSADQLQEKVEAVRRFDRFYTKRLGLLKPGFLKTQFPLTQARIIYELAQRDDLTASELTRTLDIDAGYLSRILSTFEKDGLIQKSPSKSDNRHQLLNLTTQGRKAFSILNERSKQRNTALLQSLSPEDQQRLVQAMLTVESLLGGQPKPAAPFILRPHRPGDIGWIIHRHGVLYAEEYGWDETMEALIADILARFIQHHDPRREYLWIAEQDGERVGSILVVDAGEEVAQLRILLVEPKARGRGIGKRLIQECLDFSKRAGYKKIKLWTQSILVEARHLYEKAGFTLVERKPHHSFGHDLAAEIWELPLRE
jgi:DNA-binding MarR family transcriptional regulator/GNAT superfamily N-acetyltransferase